MLKYFQEDHHLEERTIWTRKYLAGNWGGLRGRLVDYGVTTSFSYASNPMGNPVGGLSRGFTNADSFGADINIHLRYGFSFYGSVVYRSGTSLSSRRIGNQFPVQQVFGGQNFRLNELYLRWVSDPLLVKLGRLNGGNDFLQNPLYYHYVSNAFDGNPIGIFFNVPFTAYPNSVWGAYLAWEPYDFFLAKFAIFNANARVKENRFHGLNFTFKNPSGYLFMTEWAILRKGFFKTALGLYYLTKRENRLIAPPIRDKWGGYFLSDLTIYHHKDFKVIPFIALLFAPEKVNQFPFFFTAGIVSEGILPSRPKDSLNIGIAYGSYSRSTNPGQTNETNLEVNYEIQLNEWFYLTPAVQYIIRPSGRDTIDNALTVGGQMGVSF